MDFNTLFERNFIILDGAMGTMLQASGLELGGIPEELSFSNENLLIDIHKQYVDAGADIIYTNTFGANRYKMRDSSYTVDELIIKAIENAKKAAEDKALVALDIGPIGKMIEPTGEMPFDEAYDIFKEEIMAGKDADIIVFETMTDLLEIKAGLLAAKENSDKPCICTMTFEENMRTFTGVSLASMAVTLKGLGADAIGINCSLGPDKAFEIIAELSKWTDLPIVVKPNAGLPNLKDGSYDIDASMFAEYMKALVPLGVKIFGGCCGTKPEYIKTLKNTLLSCDFPNDVSHMNAKKSVISSAISTVIIDGPKIIGERINPTGKKLFKKALMEHDMGYISKQAVAQVEGGASILDVNVGLPGIDEKEMMVDAIKEIQAVVDVPLQIDSTIPEVLEAALRQYNGKPIVNSVNGEEKSMNDVLPLVKKYGASVVALTLDENGIPKKAEERFEIAKKILNRALKLGIPKEDIYIDCLTLTVSAEQDGVLETLKAVKMVKEQLGLKTVLGVSNISFGLPNRELVNQNFLTMALHSGLDLPIINPNVVNMTGAVRAYRVLSGIDKDSMDYIKNYSNVTLTTNQTVSAVNSNNSSDNSDSGTTGKERILYAINNGLKNEGRNITKELLETIDSMTIINDMLIPALDEAGKKFESGKIFLPQLILASDVAKEAFAVIKEHLEKTGSKQESKGKVILATVKGDIHDIGKNIVKVLLENYGYTVIDLGRDVPYEDVVKATIENDVHLVGLSALMTTTLVSMEKTIELLRKSNADCKIVVGGAVLTEDYAMKIGADFYAKDAKATVDIAKEIFR